LNKRKTKAVLEAETAIEKLLIRVGYTGNFKGKSVNEIPVYRIESSLPPTSDRIPAMGSQRGPKTYTGDELMGIAQMHKSNAVPIRKDNKQAAIETAQMRRN
jgi:hypothetical protein